MSTRRVNARKIVLRVASVLMKAVALYERFGFKPSQRPHLGPDITNVIGSPLKFTPFFEPIMPSSEPII